MRFALLTLLCAGACWAQLQGIVDIHAHSDPDSMPRSVDALEAARLARAAGMRALLLKNHFAPTAQLAYVVAHTVEGIQAYGGVVLNRPVGGINPAAVEQLAKFKGGYGRVVWMPTFDAENQVQVSGEKRPFVSVARNGKLLPEVLEVLAVVAREKLALETGHSSPAEGLMLIREAKRAGVTRITVTHAVLSPVSMSIEQQKEAAKMGAYLEFVYNALLPSAGAGRSTFANYARAIHAVGAEHCILSSDLGQAVNPVHTEGWKTYLDGLLKAGITQQEIDIMARRNPARFLGIE
ncbi:MAG: hypothetical protein HY238_16225 [Acidobacteria bacterium]|nr:hypothetical protein [Acidobacteriota bacterium]